MNTELTREYVVYQAQTKLLELSREIADARNINKPEVESKKIKASKIGLWITALQYYTYLDKTTIDKLVYCLADLCDANAIPYAPLPTSVDPPSILIGIEGPPGDAGQPGPEGGGIPFSKTNVTTDIVVDSFSTSLSRAAKWRYVIYGTSGQRVGSITGGWSADGLSYGDDGDIGSDDIYGNTDPVVLSVQVSGTTAQLFATVTSGTWSIEGTRVYIPNTGTSVVQPTSLADGTVWIGNSSNVPTSNAISGDITITNAGVASISSGVIVNADISSSAAIAVAKLAALAVSKAVVTTSGGVLTTSTADASKVDYLANVTSDLQAQLDTKLSATTGAISTVVSTNLTPDRLVMSNTSGKIAIGPAFVSGSNLRFPGSISLDRTTVSPAASVGVLDYEGSVGFRIATVSAVDPIVFWTNGSEKVRIDNGGNTTISGNLTLNTSNTTTRTTLTNSVGSWEAGVDNSGNGTSNNQFYIADTSYRVTVQKGTGRVGIGTTSPSTLLDVSGQINNTGGLSFDGGTAFKVKILDIGDWNMDSVSSVTISHGLTASKIRGILNISIRRDDGEFLEQYPNGISTTLDGLSDLFVTFRTSNNTIIISRRDGGGYDNLNYDATSFNRGYITILHVP